MTPAEAYRGLRQVTPEPKPTSADGPLSEDSYCVPAERSTEFCC